LTVNDYHSIIVTSFSRFIYFLMMTKRPIAQAQEPNQVKEHEDERRGSRDLIYATKNFLLVTVLASCFTAFFVGRIARIRLIDPKRRNFSGHHEGNLHDVVVKRAEDELLTVGLPDPVIGQGKAVPHTTYISKNFHTARSTNTHSRWMVTDVGKRQCANLSDHPECKPKSTVSLEATLLSDGTTLEEEHLPSGQHLLIDMENIDSVFLNSESRLAIAMLELVEQCGLTLLSYHCHKKQPSGVSCAGVLLESHVSFHSWPSQGVIILDLFTCGPNSLLPIVPVVEKLFAIASTDPSTETEGPPKMVWAHKYRGFPQSSDSAEITDMFHFPVGQMSDFKKEVVSATTKYQRVDVYDVLRPGVQSLELFKKSLLNDGSYESTHPDLFAPDRIVFLDGVLQSRRSGDAAYHESLVQPALFAHSNPRRVAIIGGGEGATLREVLKHKTVEKVIMIDIDEQMVHLSRQHLPFWSDCSMLLNSSRSCFNDPRVETYYLDAFQWFIDRFATKDIDTEQVVEEPFDVIIMDALDPQVQREFADALYNEGPFVYSLWDALSESGVLVAQVGEASTIRSPSGEYSVDRNRLKFIEALAKLGFKAIRDYEESHNGFTTPWEFIVAFKDFDTKAEWFANGAAVNLKIRERAMITTTGESPFHYFDGATMKSYRYPSKGSQVVFCRHRSTAKYCIRGHGLDPKLVNLPGLGNFTKAVIEQNSYMGLEKAVPGIFISPHTASLISRWPKEIPFWAHGGFSDILDIYIRKYGRFSLPHVSGK